MNTSYASFIKTQARNMTIYANHIGMAEEITEGDYTVICVNGVAIAKEHNYKDDVIMLEIPKHARVWFAGFNKSAQEYAKKLAEQKKNRKPANTEDLLAMLAASDLQLRGE